MGLSGLFTNVIAVIFIEDNFLSSTPKLNRQEIVGF